MRPQEELKYCSRERSGREIAHITEMQVRLGAAQRRLDMAESSLKMWALGLRKNKQM